MKVKLENLSKRWGKVVGADRIDLEITDGEFVAFLGPSGCGKTTTLLMVAGIYKPTEGSIRFDERVVNYVAPKDRNIGMVFQSYALYPHMTVFQNISYPLKLQKTSKEEMKQRAQKVADMMDIGHLMDRKPAQLSGGQQQRVALARALVIEPDAILLDEPLSNLDAKLRIEMRQEIRRIHQETGITTVYVTHDQKEALSMAQRLAVMRDGKIEQVGAPREVYSRPQNAFVAQFIGEINFVGGTLEAIDAGQRCVVNTPLGSITSECSVEDLSVGDKVRCAVRPEAVMVAPEGTHAGESNAFPAQVETRTYLGEVEQYTLRAGDDIEFKAMMLNPKEEVASTGQNAVVRFDPRDVVVLRLEG